MINRSNSQATLCAALLMGLALCLLVQTSLAVITVQIGGATRLGTTLRQRERYQCYWDCDLVGCQLRSDDDECAYDCDKVCRPKYDYSARSDLALPVASLEGELKPKSANEPNPGLPVGANEPNSNEIVQSEYSSFIPPLLGLSFYSIRVCVM